MVFNFIKKKALRKVVESVKLSAISADYTFEFQTVGIVLEKSEVSAIDKLIQCLKKQGVERHKIQILVYDAETLVKDMQGVHSYKMTDFDQTGNSTKQEVNSFIEQPFDLLISYYTQDVAPLVWVTAKSAASFKVGVSAVLNKVNHFSLDFAALNAEEYMGNLNRYVEILKTKNN
ncbi:MAG: hypothetical protein LBI72_01795 [Flavobacteriaceae bacterium]|jgi:transposase|nr:hypothetical protein [Flavobacteriaceae bacterium]